jgi:hypothetical protein
MSSAYAEQFVTNLVRVVFPTLSPAPESARVGCVRTELEVEGGVADVKSFVLVGESEGVTGAGRIDLARGHYDLELTPYTSRPGLISVAARVRVTGPIEQPKFQPIRRTVARYVARGLVSNAMRPAGAVARTLGVTAEPEYVDPCDAPLFAREAAAPEWVGR